MKGRKQSQVIALCPSYLVIYSQGGKQMSEQKEKQVLEEVNKLKSCFMVTPIGSDGSDIRRHADGILDGVINPILKKRGYDTHVSHKISTSGSINKSIIQHLVNDDLVVANLTTLNPNVMYELAIRHSFAKPVIILAEDNTNLPFDIVDQRIIFYTNDIAGAITLEATFTKFLDAIEKGDKIENPIISAVESEAVIKASDTTSEKYILGRLDQIENLLSELVQTGGIKKGVTVVRKASQILSMEESETLSNIAIDIISREGKNATVRSFLSELERKNLTFDKEFALLAALFKKVRDEQTISNIEYEKFRDAYELDREEN